MGMFDGFIGGLLGAGAMSMVEKYIQENGGVQAIVDKFDQHGLGGVARSWVSNEANQPITADQVHKVLGGTFVESLASKVGFSPEQLSQKIAEVLPEVINKMTPNGTVPQSHAA